MKPLALLAAVLPSPAARDSDGPVVTYDNNDLVLSVGSRAHDLLVHLRDGHGRDLLPRVDEGVARHRPTFSVDYSAKRVVASTFISWGAAAHSIDERHGCVLE